MTARRSSSWSIPATRASRQIATILQSAWKKIGLNVEIVEFDNGTAFGMTQKGDYQAYVSYITSDINDSDELATLEADGTGSTKSFFSNYNNPEVTKLLAEARMESDTAKRAALYGKIQEIVYNDGYSVPLNFLPYVNGYREQRAELEKHRRRLVVAEDNVEDAVTILTPRTVRHMGHPAGPSHAPGSLSDLPGAADLMNAVRYVLVRLLHTLPVLIGRDALHLPRHPVRAGRSDPDHDARPCQRPGGCGHL